MSIAWYTSYNATTGEVDAVFTAFPADAQANVRAGLALVAGNFPPDKFHIANGAAVAYTSTQRLAKASRPKGKAQWSNASMQWQDQRTIEHAAADRLEAMKEARDDAAAAGVTWDGDTFDTDEKARQAILMMVTAAKSQRFRTKNNKWRTLNAGQAKDLFAAVADHVQAQWTKFEAKEQAILAAQTIAAIEAVTWS